MAACIFALCDSLHMHTFMVRCRVAPRIPIGCPHACLLRSCHPSAPGQIELKATGLLRLLMLLLKYGTWVCGLWHAVDGCARSLDAPVSTKGLDTGAAVLCVRWELTLLVARRTTLRSAGECNGHCYARSAAALLPAEPLRARECRDWRIQVAVDFGLIPMGPSTPLRRTARISSTF